MKKIISAVLILMMLCSCSNQSYSNASEPFKSEDTEESKSQSANIKENEVRAVWMTYYELSSITKNCKDANSFSVQIKNAFAELCTFNINKVILQVRPCADAFYKSSFFPVSEYFSGVQGAQLTYDPLALSIEAAHSLNMKIEAWVNPYRVSQSNDINNLSQSNTAKIWEQSPESESLVYVSDSGIYFNPASAAVTELIVNGVREIVSGYDVDGVHFDDYFYPTESKKIDKKEFNEYKTGGGTLNLTKWRIQNVSNMVKSVYAAIKEAKPLVEFGISPSGNVKNNLSSLYADVVSWCSQEGYCDYICPQIYYGFKNETVPFMFTVKKWISLATKCKLYIGLPMYKCGVKDKYASSVDKKAIKEFINSSDIITRQIKYIRHFEEISGFYIFSYSNLVSPSNENMKKESALIKELLNNNQHNQQK